MRNRWPGVHERPASHEEAEMVTGRKCLDDIPLRRADEMAGGKDLRRGDQLIVTPGEQVERSAQRRKIDRAAERDEAAGCQLVRLEQPFDDLQIEDPRK